MLEGFSHAGVFRKEKKRGGWRELGTFSSKSWMVASVCCSSSVGFGGILVAWENWEYL